MNVNDVLSLLRLLDDLRLGWLESHQTNQMHSKPVYTVTNQLIPHPTWWLLSIYIPSCVHMYVYIAIRPGTRNLHSGLNDWFATAKKDCRLTVQRGLEHGPQCRRNNEAFRAALLGEHEPDAAARTSEIWPLPAWAASSAELRRWDVAVLRS